MIDLQKLVAQAEHHIRRGDAMSMDPEVVRELARRCMIIAGAIQKVDLDRAQNKFDEMEANDQRWRHFLGFLTDNDRAVGFHERFSMDRVPTPEEYVAAIDADRAAHMRHLQGTFDPSSIQVADDGNVTLGTPGTGGE